MKNIILSIIYLSISYSMIWFQLFGTNKIIWLKANNWWFMYIISLPITYFIVNGTNYALSEFGNSSWSVRFISYSINTFIFFLMSYFINHEGLSLKTLICLGLTFIILIIQFCWK